MRKHAYYFAWSIALHLALLLLFLLGTSTRSPNRVQKPQPEIIEASVLDEDKVEHEVAKLKQQAKVKQQRLQAAKDKAQKLLQQARRQREQEEQKIRQLAQQRQKEAEQLAQKRAQLKRQQEQEAARLAALKKQRAEAEKKLAEQRKAEQQARLKRQQAEKKRKAEALTRKKAEQARKAELARKKAEQARNAAELARKKAAEEAKLRERAARHMTIRASRAIQQKVNNSWIRPMSSRKGLRCTVRVTLLPSGDVMDVRVVKSSGDTVFDRSAENAVRKASPLPVPKDRSVFNQNFRNFTFVFKPE